VENARYSDLNSDIPAFITTETRFNVTFLLIRLVTSLSFEQVAMSTWNLGANDVSEETRTFRDKLASKGMLSDVRLRTSGLLELQMAKSLLRKTD